MAARLLCIMALLAVVLLSGCGGGDSDPVLIAGNYFPLTVGAVWVYNTILEAETPTDEFTTTGTMTRTLVGTQDLQVDGATATTYVFRHDYTTNAVPNFTGGASVDVAPFINHLFAADGGLHSVLAYYRTVAATTDEPAHIELVAVARVGEANVSVPEPRPFLYNPPYHGTMENASTWFVPMPLMPFITEMTGFEHNDKTLNYGVLGGIGGSANTIVNISYYAADLNVDGSTAAIAGRGRNYCKDGVGFWGGEVQSDWYATINVHGNTSRVTSQAELVSYAIP